MKRVPITRAEVLETVRELAGTRPVTVIEKMGGYIIEIPARKVSLFISHAQIEAGRLPSFIWEAVHEKD